MALREKEKTSPPSIRSSFLTPTRRGGIYLSITLFILYLIFGTSSTSSPSSYSSSISSSTTKLKNQVSRLTSSISDEDIYGPPIEKTKQRPLHPENSAFVPLVNWEKGVPETVVHGVSGGKLTITIFIPPPTVALIDILFLRLALNTTSELKISHPVRLVYVRQRDPLQWHPLHRFQYPLPVPSTNPYVLYWCIHGVRPCLVGRQRYDG